MRKFTANYLVSVSGVFLKNGILEVEEDGKIVQCIDSMGDLIEMEQMSFHNGILLAGFTFVKSGAPTSIPETENPVQSLIIRSVEDLFRLSLQDFINLGKQVQDHFPEMKIPDILDAITEILLLNTYFVKDIIPGVYLLSGVDLAELKFTARTKLKKIL